jgi:hypothetical protein
MMDLVHDSSIMTDAFEKLTDTKVEVHHKHSQIIDTKKKP